MSAAPVRLFHELATIAGAATGARLRDRGSELACADVIAQATSVAASLQAMGVARSDRVAIYAEKRSEAVIAMFAASMAGAVFVPVNPLLKPEQVAYILQDCNVRVLITTAERAELFRDLLAQCHDLRALVVIGDLPATASQPLQSITWATAAQTSASSERPRLIDSDMAAILYTSGSTGRPKGVVLSHRNIVEGAKSVAEYLELSASDRILCVLPLSFDYGLNQVTTAFLVGATAVLHNHLFAKDVVSALARERVTGLAAVPPLWIQLAQLDWPESVGKHLRYITNSGGAMPTATLAELRRRLPSTQPFLMYGLTEAFRSTYLPPSEVDRRPESMGKAIPNAEILVVREDGSPCAPGEPGELVHRGVHVSMGYWNDPAKTAERFKPAPGHNPALPITEFAVWSGDTVKRDEEGFLYFVSRRDEMIKTSGYRVSPTEIEEVLYATGLVGEVAAFGLPHATLGQAIAVVATPADGAVLDAKRLVTECQKRLPAYMVPQHIEVSASSLPRNPNGKIDRKALAMARAQLFPGGAA